MKKLLYPLAASVVLSLIFPIAQLVVDPINSFSFLVICLLFAFPICFAGIGLFCGTQTQSRAAWVVPFACVSLWTVVSGFALQTTDMLFYCAMYLGISYAVMLLTALMIHFLRKKHNS